MGKLARTALAIDEDLLARFERWMAAHGYSNRSEAMRDQEFRQSAEHRQNYSRLGELVVPWREKGPDWSRGPTPAPAFSRR